MLMRSGAEAVSEAMAAATMTISSTAQSVDTLFLLREGIVRRKGGCWYFLGFAGLFAVASRSRFHLRFKE